MTRPGSNGEQVYMTDQEIAAELSDARKAAATWCK